MRNVHRLVALAICLAVPAHAQTGTAYAQASTAQAQTGTIAGIVIDDRTEQPIKDVSVSVEGQSIVTETDANGRFSLVAPRGPQTITASVIGYALLRTEVEVGAAGAGHDDPTVGRRRRLYRTGDGVGFAAP